jgi:hypothetical protein
MLWFLLQIENSETFLLIYLFILFILRFAYLIAISSLVILAAGDPIVFSLRQVYIFVIMSESTFFARDPSRHLQVAWWKEEKGPESAFSRQLGKRLPGRIPTGRGHWKPAGVIHSRKGKSQGCTLRTAPSGRGPHI